MKAFEVRTPDKTGVYSFERAAAKLTPEFEKLLKSNPAANQLSPTKPRGIGAPRRIG
jgi:hypothetical protein